MFRIRKPTDRQIAAFLDNQARQPFTYRDVGATRKRPPQGWTVDESRIQLGAGRQTFDRAVHALRDWRQFQLSWLEVFADGPPRENQPVAVLVRHGPFWSLHACRVVYVFEEGDEQGRRFGFAYGTLPTHAESGEERFEATWLAKDDFVHYRILAFSRPRHWMARLAYPVTRLLQKRFARDSQRAMTWAVESRPIRPPCDSTA